MRVPGCLALVMAMGVAAGAQQVAAPVPSTSVVDIAPVASERFPAEWYPPENDYTHTSAPTVGAPFTGESVMTMKMQGHPSYELHMRTMRDGAGRTRTEEFSVGTVSGADQGGTRQIEVNDVVRHCTFRWVEPVGDRTRQEAQVACLSRKLNWSDDGMEAKMTRQTPEVSSVYPGQKDQTEPLGEKMILGLRALGIRQTRTSTKTDGTMSIFVSEVWWSPELKEMLVAQPIGDTVGMPSIELRDIRRGEPDGALFYPPAGWKIVPQPFEHR
jgi:hypothetical protein